MAFSKHLLLRGWREPPGARNLGHLLPLPHPSSQPGPGSAVHAARERSGASCGRASTHRVDPAGKRGFLKCSSSTGNSTDNSKLGNFRKPLASFQGIVVIPSHNYRNPRNSKGIK